MKGPFPPVPVNVWLSDPLVPPSAVNAHRFAVAEPPAGMVDTPKALSNATVFWVIPADKLVVQDEIVKGTLLGFRIVSE